MDNIANVIHSLPRDDYASCIEQFIPERSPFTTEHFEIIAYQMIRSIFGIPGASAEYKKAKAKFLKCELANQIFTLRINYWKIQGPYKCGSEFFVQPHFWPAFQPIFVINFSSISEIADKFNL